MFALMKHVWRLWSLTQLFFQFGPWHESFDPIRVTLNWPTGPKVWCPCLPQSLLFSMYCEGLFVCEFIQNPVSGRTLQGSACPTKQLLFPFDQRPSINPVLQILVSAPNKSAPVGMLLFFPFTESLFSTSPMKHWVEDKIRDQKLSL